MSRPFAERMCGERGAVLVAVLCALMGLSAVAMAAALLATIETRIASVIDARAHAEVAAHAAIEAAGAELGLDLDWNEILAGRRVSTLLTGQRLPTVPGWGALDLDALTARLQRGTDAGSVWAADTALWRLYLHGAPAELFSVAPPRAPPYASVWVADDEADGDGRPEEDSNGLITVRAEAFASGRAHAVIVATLRRRPAGVELISWRSPPA